jgi:hypothetical protein
VKNFIYCAVTPYCDDRIGLARLRAKPARITAFPCHMNLDAMSEPALPYHGRPQRLAAGNLAVNDKAQGFFGHHRNNASTSFSGKVLDSQLRMKFPTKSSISKEIVAPDLNI